MGGPRTRAVIKSRRRAEDDGEEEGGSTTQVAEEDSLSEASITTDAEDEADGENSDNSGTESSLKDDNPVQPILNGHKSRVTKVQASTHGGVAASALPTVTGDTEAMMNGLAISDNVEAEEIHFDDLTKQPGQVSTAENSKPSDTENIIDRRRREHEEYKKKRDTDPAFVPNRGGFFMHDHRSFGPGQNGFRPLGRVAMRGRGAPMNPLVTRYGLPHPLCDIPLTQTSSDTRFAGATEAPWAHDLHETVAQPSPKYGPGKSHSFLPQNAIDPSLLSPNNSQAPNRTFSTTTRLGDMQIKVLLNTMSEPKSFSSVARFSYTKLPYHRPPLRRDKPVRISIPYMDVKYVFPAPDRSFIFIPRALRPNQQGFGRPRGRGSFGNNFNNYGPMSSRKSSIHTGSGYTPTAILSRRSSLAREMTLSGMTSPLRGNMPQQETVPVDAGKPVVRLPPHGVASEQQGVGDSPTVKLPQASAYTFSQQPTSQGSGAESIPMHHPKPERSLQVADIESPAAMELNASAAHQQAFHQQVPVHMRPQPYPLGPLPYPHSRHPSHPSQNSGGTPLPQIPEAAIHAQPFQPFAYPPQQGYIPQQYPVYYYPVAEQGTGSPVTGGPFVPTHQYFYPASAPSSATPQIETAPQGGTVAHEAGGMVYYYNPSDLAPPTGSSSPFPQTYSTAPPAGMEGIISPSYYPQQPFYYPPAPPPQPPQ